MKEQDLINKFLRVEDDTTFYWNGYYDQRMLDDEVLPHAEKCVQIAKDYAEQEVRNAKLPYQLFIGKVINILGQEKTTELLKESKDAFKNRENER